MKVKLLSLIVGLALVVSLVAHAQDLPIGADIPGARIDWHPDGTMLAVATNQTVQIIDANNQQAINTLPTFTDFVNDVRWSPNGSKVAVATGFSVQIWDQPWNANNMQLVLTIQIPVGRTDYGVISIDWHPNSNPDQLLGVSPSKVHIWDTSTGQLLQTFTPNPNPLLAARWSPDGNKIALGDITGGILIEDLTTGQSEFEEAPDYSAIRSLAWSPNGNRLVAGTASGLIRMLTLEPFLTGSGTLELSTLNIVSLDWNPTADHVFASGSVDGSLVIWDLTTQEPVEEIQQSNGIPSIAWSPDGSQLAYSGTSGTVQIVPAPQVPTPTPTNTPTNTPVATPTPTPTSTPTPVPVPPTCTAAIAAGDVPGLINAITTANGSSGADTICLQPGMYTLTSVNNVTDGPNGLPTITSTITLVGLGPGATIRRDDTAPLFRLLYVTKSNALTLDNLTLTNGNALDGATTFFTYGGAVYNNGTVTISNTTITGNVASLGGGIYAFGKVNVTDSAITNNSAEDEGGAMFNKHRQSSVHNSCIEGNSTGQWEDVVSWTELDATNNWWGAANGPSGAGSGSGDSVNANVAFDPFITTGCPN